MTALLDLETRIRLTARRVEDDRAKTLRWLAEAVIDQPFLESTCLTMIRPLCDDGLSEDDIGLLFAGLTTLVRSAQTVNAQTGGDSTRLDSLIDTQIDRLLGRDAL